MNQSLRAALLTSMIVAPGAVLAGVPMDSFNSANAALLPSTAVDRHESTPSTRGPADALVRMALGTRKNNEPAVTAPVQSDSGRAPAQAP